MQRLKKIINNDQVGKHILNYLSGEIIVKVIAIIAIPIITRLLTTEEYGIFSIFNTSLQIGMIILSLGVASGVSRYFFEKNINFSAYMGSNLMFISIYMVILILSVIFLFHQIIPLQFDLVVFLLFASYFAVFLDIFQKYLMSAKESKKYSNTLVINHIIFYGIGIILTLLFDKEKYYGLVLAKTIAMVLLGGYSLYKLIKLSEFTLNKNYIYYTLKYSTPLLPAILANIILVQFDRYAIQDITNNLSEVGIYSFAYSIGMILNTIIMAITNSWRPYFYEKMNKNDYSNISNLIIRNTKMVLILSLIFLLFNKEIVIIMSSPSYYDAVKIIPSIIISYIVIYFYTVYFQYLSYSKKTLYISINSCIAAVINIITNYLFIPKYGYIAAAYTTLFSYVILLSLTYIAAWKYNRDSLFKFSNFNQDIASLTVIYFTYLIIEQNINSVYLLLIIKLLVLLIFSAFLIGKKGELK